MVEEYLCRLCVTPCNISKSLVDIKSGKFNVIYEMAAKYFDSKFLAPREEFTINCICINCWININEFHNYQKTVWQAQSKLVDLEVKHELPVVNLKQEIEEVTPAEPADIYDIVQINAINQATEKNISKIGTQNEPDNTTNNMVVKAEQNLGSVFEIFEVNSNIEEKKIDTTQNAAPESKNSNNIESVLSVPETKESSDQSYIDDFLISRWMGDLECIICQEFWPNYTLLSKHFEEVHLAEECHIVCCTRQINNRTEILQHLKEFHGIEKINTYKCIVCPALFSEYWSLRLHLRQCLSNEYERSFDTNTKQTQISSANNKDKSSSEDMEISISDKSSNTTVKHYTKGKSFINDNFIAEWMGELQCTICRKFWGNFSQLNHHFIKVHPNQDFYVVCCLSKIKKRCRLVEHINKFHRNFDKKTYNCDKCTSAFIYYKSLRLHIQKLHAKGGSSFYKCNKCLASFPNHWNLRLHIRKNHPSTQIIKNLRCNFFKNSFKSRTSLETHKKYHIKKLINVKHSDIPDDDFGVEGSTVVVEIDAATTSEPVNPPCILDIDEDISLSSISSSNDEENSDIISNDIEQQISQLSNVNEQLEESNDETDIPSTSQCINISDDSDSNIDEEDSKHIQVSSAEKALINILDIPIAIAIGRLICPHCKKSFIYYSLLNDHFIEEHPQERCYLNCCNDKFYETATIVDHLRKFHQNVLHKCMICGKVYIVHENLRTHIRINHGATRTIQIKAISTNTELDKQIESQKSNPNSDNEEIEIHVLSENHQNNDSIDIDTDDTISVCSDDDVMVDMPTNTNSKDYIVVHYSG